MKIQLKRSNVLDNGNVAKKPTAEQMEYGELAVNYNATDPVIFLKDSNDQIIEININKIGSIDSGITPPNTNNGIGDLFFNTNLNLLLFWSGSTWVPLNTNLGYTQDPTKGTVTSTSGNDTDIPLADGTYAGLLSPAQYTKLLNLVGVDLDSTSNGLTLNSNNKLSADIATTSTLGTVKIGTGLGVANDGTISVTDSGSSSAQNLSYTQGATNNVIQIDGGGTDTTILLASDSLAGLMSPGQYQVLDNLNSNALTSTTGTYELSYNTNNDNAGTVKDTGDSTIFSIPIATNSEAGLMTGEEKGELAALVLSSGSGSGTGGTTAVNLGYTEAADQGTVTCSEGDNAVIPIATDQAAGLMTPGNFTKLSTAVTSVNLSHSFHNNGIRIICDAGDNTVIPWATTTEGGLITAATYNVLNDLDTNALTAVSLSYSEASNGNGGEITCVDGTFATIPFASASNPGLITSSDYSTLSNLGSALTSVHLGYSPSNTGSTITNSAGDPTTIPFATATNEGVISAADYITFSSNTGNVKLNDGGTLQMMYSKGLAFSSSSSSSDISIVLDPIEGRVAATQIAAVTVNANSFSTYYGLLIRSDGSTANTTRKNISIGTTSEDNLKEITSGDSNVAIGASCLKESTTGSNNIAIGESGLKENTTGSNNIAIGESGLEANVSGVQNIGIGYRALYKNVDKKENIGIGYQALENLGTGDGNIAIGWRAMYLSGQETNSANSNYQDVNYSIGIGHNALANFNPKTTTTDTLNLDRVNIAIGHNAGVATTEGHANTVIGYQAHYANTEGFHNTVLGYKALHSSVKCTGNTVIGTNALLNFTNAAINTNNVVVGKNTMRDSKDCQQNTAVGNAALINSEGDYNVAVGQSALSNCTTGHSNTAIGFFAASSLTNGVNSTCVGNGSQVSASNQVQLGNSSTTTYVYGTVQDRSDARDKTDIRDTLLGLDFIKSLRPVDFRWDYREDYYDNEEYTEDGETLIRKTAVPQDGSRGRTRYHHGLIAQEVKQAADSQNIDFAGYQDHSIKGGDDVLSIGYSELIAPLIKAVQQLSEENADLKARLEVLENS